MIHHQVYSIESDPAYAAIAKKMVATAGLSSVVTIIEGKVCDVIPKLKSEHFVSHVDFCFVDHWKDFYLSDVQLLEGSELLRPGSRIVADNILYPGNSRFNLKPVCLGSVFIFFFLAQAPPSSCSTCKETPGLKVCFQLPFIVLCKLTHPSNQARSTVLTSSSTASS